MSKKLQVPFKSPEGQNNKHFTSKENFGISEFSSSTDTHEVALQKSLGNRVLKNMFLSEKLQPKLKVNKPGDNYEKEADRVADQVVNSEFNNSDKFSKNPGGIQRKCSSCASGVGTCAGCEDEELHRKAISSDQSQIKRPINLFNNGVSLNVKERSYYEPRFGTGFKNVRIHKDSTVNKSAEMLNARAFTVGNHIAFGRGEYNPDSENGRKLLAHELAHVIQQKGSSGERNNLSKSGELIQRDLALQPPENVRDQDDLNENQVRRAIRFNNAIYNEESTNLIQDLVGAEQTGTFDESTVRMVAGIQERFGIEADGKVGNNTYDLLIRELQAEGTTPGTCLTMFRIIGPERLRFFRNSPTTGTIGSRFFVRIKFDPRCKCEDWEYRQHIAGTIILNDVSGTVSNISSSFAVPGGLRTTLTEDGDVTIPVGISGRRYGHRSDRRNTTDDRDRYLPDRRTGCEYRGHDFPELTPIPAAPGDVGDVYQWNMRFRGSIIRKGHGVVEQKFWNIRRNVTVV